MTKQTIDLPVLPNADDLLKEDFLLETDESGKTEYKTVDYGRRPTRALFYEYKSPLVEPLYTVHFQDRTVNGVVYKSMRKVFIDLGDPTEWAFVQKVCHGDWAYWAVLQRALNSYILKPKKDNVDRWRKELEIKLRSDALLTIYRDAKSDLSQSSVSSAKWLAEGKYKLKEPTGAPTDSGETNKADDLYLTDIERMAQFAIDKNATIQ